MTESERASRLLAAACIVSAVVTAGALWYTTGFLHKIDSTLSELTRMADQPQEFRSSWKDAAGVTHTVVTPRNAGETAAAWAARHQEAEEALKALFPVAP